MASDLPNCPRCGGALVRIVYGLPTGALSQKAKRGDVVLGGCMLPPEESRPTHACRSCGRHLRVDASGSAVVLDEKRV